MNGFFNPVELRQRLQEASIRCCPPNHPAIFSVYKQNLIFVMSFVKKNKANSCLPAARSPESNFAFQKYVIVDSENEDQVIHFNHHDSLSHIKQGLITAHKASVVLKSKPSTVTNFLSNFSEPQTSIDHEISSAEQQLQNLQKECELLENLIADMIEEQSQLTVKLKRQQRAITISKNEIEPKYIEYNLHNVSQMEAQSMYFNQNQQLKSKLHTITLKKALSLATSDTSKNSENNRRKSSQKSKIIQLKNKKLNNGKQNSQNTKLEQTNNKNMPNSKAKRKNRVSISKMPSKAD